MSRSEKERQRRGSRGLFGAFLTVLILAIVVGVLSVLVGKGPRPGLHPAGEEGGSSGRDSILLFFAAQDGSELQSENRGLLQVSTVRETLRQTVQELINGPRQGLLGTLPRGTQLLDLFLDDQGIVFLNFNKAISEDHPGGVWMEILTVSSLVQSLTANFELVRGVRILIEGRPAETLAGHVDIRRPLTRAATEMGFKATSS
jgi:spore germination protein GerM